MVIAHHWLLNFVIVSIPTREPRQGAWKPQIIWYRLSFMSEMMVGEPYLHSGTGCREGTQQHSSGGGYIVGGRLAISGVVIMTVTDLEVK